jgi:DNA-binding NarL/FixJ family response regulator
MKRTNRRTVELMVGVTRVMIVDDSPHFRRGLRHVLDDTEQIVVVGEAGNGVDAIDLARQLVPDVVLLDVRMPRGDGLLAAQSITVFVPDSRVLMLTVSDNPEDIALAAKVGAAGYLLKERSLEEIADAVLSVADGGRWPLAAG